MKKTSLLACICFLVFSVAEVKAKCFEHCYFHIGSSTYTNWTGDYSFNEDTVVYQQLSFPMQIRYDYSRECDYYQQYLVSALWKKNGDTVSNAIIYTVTDTGLYEGI